MKRINKLHRAWWFLPLAMPLAPLMVVASCGSQSEVKEVVDPTSFLATISTKAADIPALSGFVVWSTGFNAGETPILPVGIQSIEFVLGDYPTQVAAEAVYETKKVTTLPVDVAPEYDHRFLWAFLTPAVGYKFKDDLKVFDITTSSKVQAINYSLSEDKVYKDFFNSLTDKVVVSGSINNPSFDLSAFTIPGKLAYQFATKTDKIDIAELSSFSTAGEAIKWAMNLGYTTAQAINDAVTQGKIFFYLLFKSTDSHYYLGYNPTEGHSVLLNINLV